MLHSPELVKRKLTIGSGQIFHQPLPWSFRGFPLLNPPCLWRWARVFGRELILTTSKKHKTKNNWKKIAEVPNKLGTPTKIPWDFRKSCLCSRKIWHYYLFLSSFFGGKCTLLGTNISHPSRHFWVDDCPFPQVGYVILSLEGTLSPIFCWLQIVLCGKQTSSCTCRRRKSESVSSSAMA